MSTPRDGQSIPAPDTYHCKPCHLSFKTEKAFKIHKIRSGRHIYCDICGIDFNNEDAKKAHRTAAHAAEQDLNCPYCQQHFNRLGGLVGHWELTECRVLPKEVFDKARQEISDRQEAVRLAHNFQGYGRSSTDNANEPLPPIGRPVSSGSDPAFPGYGGNNYENAQAPLISFDDESASSTAMSQEEFLISFDEESAILNAPWGMPLVRVLEQAKSNFKQVKDSPAMNNSGNLMKNCYNTQGASIKASDIMTAGSHIHVPANKVINQTQVAPATQSHDTVWSGSAKFLFPHAPPDMVPASTLLKALTITPPTLAPTKVYGEFDPENPKFATSKFFNIYTKKFKCPHNGCGKSQATETSFIAHLKSPAHRSEKLQCIMCLRYFDTATALTQHSESQGVRCTVRNSDNYESVIVGVTANTAIPVGRWEDDTIKYGVNPEASPMVVTSIVEAHRAAHKAKNDAFNNYWNERQARW